MISSNIAVDQSAAPPKVSIYTMLRLGLFQVGLGMMSVLIFGVLNQILIKELKVDPAVASAMLAMTLFVAPARVWFGQMSDTKQIFGHHRTGYIWVGIASLALSVTAAVQVMWRLGESLRLDNYSWSAASYGWAILLGLLFGVYGLSVSASSTPFATLLVDVTDEDDRSKIVAIDWSMLLVGVIIGAITIGVILASLKKNASIEVVQAQVNRLFLIVPLAVCALTFLATFGVEKKYSRFASRQQAATDLVGLKRAWQILNTNRQTKVFFTFLVFMTMGLFMQDTVLETYGSQVFDLPTGQAAQLNAFFGSGTVVGLLIAGFIIIPNLGKQRSARFGCGMVAYSMAWLIAAGFTGNIAVLKLALVLFGLCSGVVTTSALTLMLDLTLPETAGTFIGAWGLSQALAKGIANILGGWTLSIGKMLWGATEAAETPLVMAYGLVFVFQALMMILAIQLLKRVNVKEFKAAGSNLVRAAIDNSVD
jgi:MFS transporter, BCD family, chlorophyll transporter